MICRPQSSFEQTFCQFTPNLSQSVLGNIYFFNYRVIHHSEKTETEQLSYVTIKGVNRIMLEILITHGTKYTLVKRINKKLFEE